MEEIDKDQKDMTDQEWRDVRYLYNYNKEELTDLANKVRIIEQKLKGLCRI